MTAAPMRAILLAGPTASGKSSLAVELARSLGSVVVNADSMQVYREWRILTARPSEEEMQGVPHLLYGHVGLQTDYSVGHWLNDLKSILPPPGTDMPPPVIAGGTGAYFTALTSGIASIPQIPAKLRKQVEIEMAERGLDSLASELRRLDPETADAVALDNPRRVTRALEVLRHTGKGLAAWHQRTKPPMLRLEETEALVLAPDPAELRSRVERRFALMMEAGAMEEVAKTREMVPVPDGRWPLGGRELAACLDGMLSKKQAMENSITAIMQYAKRQRTWFRNKLAAWPHGDFKCSSLLLKRVTLRLAASPAQNR